MGIRKWVVRSRKSDFYSVARHTRQVPSAELAVAEAALTDGGPLAEPFVSQLRDAPDVWRLIADDGSYELRVSTSMGVDSVPRSGWRSDPISVRALPAGRLLEITLHISMAGIIEIHGRSLDGQPWPDAWSLAPEDLEAIRRRSPLIRLPTPEELRDQRARAVEVIESWLAEPGLLSGQGGVAVEPPATSESIAAFEAAQHFALPDAYLELLLATNGFEIGTTMVLGTYDAYCLDIPGPDRLVIAPPQMRTARSSWRRPGRWGSSFSEMRRATPAPSRRISGHGCAGASRRASQASVFVGWRRCRSARRSGPAVPPRRG